MCVHLCFWQTENTEAACSDSELHSLHEHHHHHHQTSHGDPPAANLPGAPVRGSGLAAVWYRGLTILFTVQTQEELRRGFYPSIGGALCKPWKKESPMDVREIRFGCSFYGRLLFHNCASPDWRGVTSRLTQPAVGHHVAEAEPAATCALCLTWSVEPFTSAVKDASQWGQREGSIKNQSLGSIKC